MLTRAIIHVIEGLGYAVRTTPAGEMFAQRLDDLATRHVVTLDDPADPDARYRAACRLAEAVGIDLEG